MTKLGDIIYLTVNGLDVAHVVEFVTPVSMPMDHKVDGKTVYKTGNYTALKVRPATAGEVERWRFGGTGKVGV